MQFALAALYPPHEHTELIVVNRYTRLRRLRAFIIIAMWSTSSCNPPLPYATEEGREGEFPQMRKCFILCAYVRWGLDRFTRLYIVYIVVHTVQHDPTINSRVEISGCPRFTRIYIVYIYTIRVQIVQDVQCAYV